MENTNMENSMENPVLKNLTIEDVLPDTYQKRKLDFCVGKEWELVDFFVISGQLAYVNDVLCQVTSNGNWYPIKIRGENYCSCAVCDTPIVYHYTVQEKTTKQELNVGSECIKHVINPKLAEEIVQFTNGIMRKAKSQNRRLPQNKQLQQFIIDNFEELKARRKFRIDLTIKLNPVYFWDSLGYISTDPKTKKETIIWHNYEWDIKEWKEKNPSQKNKSDVEIRNIIRKQRGDYAEWKERNTWVYLRDNLVKKNWNPNTMKKVIESETSKDGLDIKIKWNELTEEEKIQENNLIIESVNQYIKRMENRKNKRI